MNPTSLAKTSTTAKIIDRIALRGYQRKANAVHEAFPEVAMNIVPNPAFSVMGALVDFPETDFPALETRETGYTKVDVTNAVTGSYDTPVYTFIAPNVSEYHGKCIAQDYLNVCLGGVPDAERGQWLLETVVECGISGTLNSEQYRHA